MLTAVVLARNQAHNLPQCLKSLRFCNEILLIDDDSSDNTSVVARTYGAKVFRRSMNGDFSAQRNYALSLVKTGWVLFVDSDEEVSWELSREIANLPQDSSVKGYFLKREDIVWKRRLKYGDLYGFRILRLGKHDAGIWKGKVHEVWNISPPLGTLESPLLHYPHQDTASFLHKINRYTSIRARELYDRGRKSGILSVVFYPVFKFLFNWLIKMGFRDGLPGFIHAVIMSFHVFLVRGKHYLLTKGVSDS
ncbi:MAG: Glycosyl transferase family 2 [Candidatus Amesbacteria bacterium GW2011_GWA1_47_16]|uniref:Glycosyl transferase family 2 n=3 Tax=Candidatus Amesiibacteriota TaxID=1752730 RepID=A0A0G1UEB3_9BACT|nr:MAG: Glycosyl transferase family 2 [Candidatus Amesbacteria bacterium GW2011_GWA1_47_16]KKU64468.1 MAG: Glycosyl transferase family 2 [Candidatus Amesbacteria bacterium GW2011_GWC1_47_15]OGC99503.1 MAG: hypothetical protein A2701_04250 [Candidatus Amesbacteria bacterium RIFCSPHIGHO2_01_FULL_47_34]OGD10998.1 MAG: hypothetical protein A2576_04055 [Candidatus Amesbacteria bacterium RIFOXYD1_FULL_47_9]